MQLEWEFLLWFDVLVSVTCLCCVLGSYKYVWSLKGETEGILCVLESCCQSQDFEAAELIDYLPV